MTTDTTKTEASDQPATRAAFFDALYEGSADPWDYHTCDYEIAKRAATIAALPRPHYARACEIGCSNGVLTRDLAPYCDALIGIDVAEAAAASARTAVAGFPHVEIRVMHVPHALPPGAFDLLMLSEVLYFFSAPELAALAEFAGRQVVPGGTVMIVSFDGATLTALDGRASTEVFTAAAAPWFDIIEDGGFPHYHRRILRRKNG